jgi:hypothetical protein
MKRSVLVVVAAMAMGGSVVFAACGGGGDDAPSGGTQSTGTQGTSTGTAGGTGSGGSLFNDGGMDDVVSIAITPADPVMVVPNGVIPAPITFTGTGTTTGGSTIPVTGMWSFDRYDVASINPGTGTLTASGLVEGVGTVTLKVGNLTATTSATVKLLITSDPESIDPAIKGTFGSASVADPAMTLLYPYDKTVFPRGLTGPVIQWNGGNAADIYYVHANSPTFELEAWGTVPPPSRYTFPTLPTDVWRKLTDSTTGDITVEIQRYDGSQAYLAKEQTWKIAPANLAGTIYYWEVNSGNVVRIKPGDTGPENFIQKPPGVECVACHSVSKDGSRIVASLHGGYSPWATFQADNGASLYSTFVANVTAGPPSGFQAISPTGSHVVWGQSGETPFITLSTYDNNASLAQLTPGGGFPVQPAWAGDPTKLAFAVRSNGNWLDYTQSNLWITDVDLVNPSFSNPHMIVASDPSRPTVTFPTFAPDSKWIAFERSTQARSRNGVSDIWLTNLDGTVQMPLDQTNGVGVLTGAEVSSTYEPTFNPVSVGGYFWLVVVSERTYGNTLTDTDPVSRRKQLWVSAIDASPVAGQDPSHPGFWLPGQALDNNNMRGEWALSPCKMIGESCEAGFECCDGFCHDDGNGNQVCSDQPGGCSNEGEACDSAADCCDPDSVCTGGFCAPEMPR